MYNKRAQLDEDDEPMANTTQHDTSDSNLTNNNNSLSDLFMFHSTDPYSDEQSVKSCLSNIINIIELEEQSQLKNNITLFSDLNKSYSNNKKRKLDQLNDSNNNNNNKSVNDETNKKVFDPIQEHFNWCPWVSRKQQNKLICQINFEIVNKFMLKTNQKQSDPNSFNLPDMSTYLLNRTKSTDDVVVNSQLLLDKIKSAQSILINSTSNYSFK